MSTTLRKCIVLGPDGTMTPAPTNPQHIAYEPSPRTFANLIFLLDSQTKWVKLWLHLPSMWPTKSFLSEDLRNHLDFQIAVAKSYGFGVILGIHHDLPSWINGGVRSTDIPLDTSETGNWAQMFSAFASRYCATNPARPYNGLSQVDIFEFCNEPNQLWTTNTNGNTDIPGTVAILFKRAKKIAIGLGNAPLVAGPGVSDMAPDVVTGDGNYYDFTQKVLQRLAGNGFYDLTPHSVCVWTHHNYSDVTYDHGATTKALDRDTYMKNNTPQFDRFNLRSAWARALLVNGGWRGWPAGDPSNPRMFITEGGAKAQVVMPRWKITDPAQFPAKQSELVARNLIRLSDDTAKGGAGADMTSNYLLITVKDQDTGMFEPPTSLAARPLYTNTWKPYPGRL
jgi:hypothetical protein